MRSIRIILELSGSELARYRRCGTDGGGSRGDGHCPAPQFRCTSQSQSCDRNLLPVTGTGRRTLSNALYVEAVRGKPLSPKVMHYIQNAGVGLIILLMLLAMKNDVVRILRGG